MNRFWSDDGGYDVYGADADDVGEKSAEMCRREWVAVTLVVVMAVMAMLSSLIASGRFG